MFVIRYNYELSVIFTVCFVSSKHNATTIEKNVKMR